ncbi:MAG: cyclodeaminase/cyclohydrolase family protein [Lachnospiraceae bacterium]|nr:cyclodeaminase/cyclohydrolase family protein [Lachnospiraceae bacterium]
MDVRKLTVEEYLDKFAGSEPVPGGGGVCGVVGALAAAAGEMVCSLTIGKKKFENIEPEVRGIAMRLKEARENLISLADKDAEVFEPLAESYKDKTKTEAEMDMLYSNAAGVPLDIIKNVYSILDEFDYLADNASRLAISDAACAAVYARAAIAGEILNVKINTRCIKNAEIRYELEKEADLLYQNAMKKCDRIFDKVLKGFE